MIYNYLSNLVTISFESNLKVIVKVRHFAKL